MLRNKLIIILIFLIAICSAHVSYSQIAIVVNKNNPVENISSNDLQKIFLGEQSSFENGNLIVIGINSTLKKEFFKKLYNWSDLKYNKHWMKMIFAGENFVAPKDLEQIAVLKSFIKLNKGSISFIEYSKIDEDFKVLTIDGKLPDSEDYLFNKTKTKKR